ncbi:uncharacterized protein PGTG_19442 [Puccinia graminis f. sp. tritici CRL 75-36-700-3]|uniref:Uncharacterized protein n=1 Tax=Puccinia graminis f. sp. tritici (strain CRL 75-36-700-3 / race SCCL) TaxID=418459 RepID=E3L9H8_PUCGT|nr:uncharacterized protein PGTG_19442 [Puccinia graminis f. sp. tritici CRL 75-36-700-3]EFP93203.1 hypothetical protein PGTG_19442 [Puccinia graminis f. sp. tritici CRL 75-36-700-3]
MSLQIIVRIAGFTETSKMEMPHSYPIPLLLQGHHGMQPADEAAHVRRVVEHLIPHTSGQTETRFDPELQSVFTPSAQQVGHSNGGHIVIDVIGDSSRSITSPADFRQLDFETGAHAEAQETPAHQTVDR